MSETCRKWAFTHPIVVLKVGCNNNWMKKLDRVNRPLEILNVDFTIFCCGIFHSIILRATFCKNDTKSSNLTFDPLRFCSCFGQNTCIGEKLEHLKAQLDRSCTFRVTDISSLPYNPLKMQNSLLTIL